jgi:hypothetical protein
MYHQSSKRKEIILRTITYTLMSLAVLTLVTFLVMTMLGYRFNQTDGSLVQGGLVQFSSQPSNARVFINGNYINSTTNTKATLQPGEHDIMLQRANYRDWKKQVDVRPGTVTWVNYARLVPEDLTPKQIRQFDELDAALSSPDNKWFALLPDESKPDFVMANLDRNEPEFEEISLPEGSFTAAPEDIQHNFKPVKWSSNGRHLIIEHSYGDNREWLVLDREQPDEVRNITTLLNVNASQVQFVDNSGKLFYVLDGSDVRRINLDDATLSRPLISNVKSFRYETGGDKLITYESLPEDGKRDLGYFNDDNDDAAVVIRTVDDASDAPLQIAIGEYYDETYTALAIGDRVEILKGDLPESDSVSSQKLIETIDLSGEVSELKVRGGGRFIYVLSGATYTTYDLEQQSQYTTRLATDEPAPRLNWLDEYIVWSDFGGKLQLYAFDGANHQEIASVAPGYGVSLARGGRFVYSIAQLDDGQFSLQQVRLVL